jgi:small-conductance mechanosensitive channel
MLKSSVKQTAKALSKLDSLLVVLVGIICFFICVNILRVDIAEFMSAFIALWVGIVFAVGGTVKNLLESCIFLFATHPYDIGDKVVISDESLKVLEFGLTSTTFQRGDGTRTLWPNIVLASKPIYNIRRSGGLLFINII